LWELPRISIQKGRASGLEALVEDANGSIAHVNSTSESARVAAPGSPAESGRGHLTRPGSPIIAAVVPAYRTARQIAAVLESMPPEVAHVIVVDDSSPDDLAAALASISDPRLVVLRHATNRGVGAAVKTGFAHAASLGADIVVKVDSDGQMDPAAIPMLVAPILSGQADLVKGNRFADLDLIGGMPLVRRVGNVSLAFLVKLASGYWSLFDPCNGFVAVRTRSFAQMQPERLADRYFFEISLLCEAYLIRAVVREIPMAPHYHQEPSSLNPLWSLIEFLPRLARRSLRRMALCYFFRDFNLVSLFLITGVPLFVFGAAWSALAWLNSWRTMVTASTGTVMIGTLAIILGFQLLLEAIVLDVQNEPKWTRP
jgi:dolichol-phosphate mannosyltransferase